MRPDAVVLAGMILANMVLGGGVGGTVVSDTGAKDGRYVSERFRVVFLVGAAANGSAVVAVICGSNQELTVSTSL